MGLAGAAAKQPLAAQARQRGERDHGRAKAAPELALGILLFNSAIAGDADNAWTLNAASGTQLRIWGTAVAMLIGHLRPLAVGLGYVGSARTIYSRFVACGQNIAFPKGAGLIIRLAPARHNGSVLPLPQGNSLGLYSKEIRMRIHWLRFGRGGKTGRHARQLTQFRRRQRTPEKHEFIE
ncbi:MAG: hypothetical protein EPN33_14435 [Acidobacteria bacterium]|nr:MAG: hypothetical protein EPN33_14435 [Acidobacteriota bacterium]